MKASVIALAIFATAPARADVIRDWTEVALTSGGNAKHSPYVQTRTLAMVHLAIFEAVNGTDGRYRSYLKLPPAPRLLLASVTGGTAESGRAARAAAAAHE